MEAATKNKGAEDEMDGDEESENLPEPTKAPPTYPARAGVSGGGERASAPAPSGGGYFRIYKKGQGYWTRMGTVAGVGLIGILTCSFLWDEKMYFKLQERGGYILVAVFAAVYTALAFHYMNTPTSVDFLIATDSEMKKVNWTTKDELIGSTKVVIGFVFITAVLLFVYDLFFQTVFWFLGVLKTPPFFIKH